MAHLDFHLQELAHTPYWYVALVIAYLLGAIPFGLIIAKLFLGIDIRQVGSGNIGMTNVMRTAGKGPGIATFVLDLAKGSLAVWLVKGAFDGPEFLELLTAFLAVFGHTKSIFMGFKGGKGVSTNFGVWLVLDWRVFLAMAAIWLGMFIIKRISSLSALSALTLLPGLVALIRGFEDQVFLAALLSVYLILLHRSNIYRLLAGDEGQLKAGKN
ncbi:MAG: acyl-phosphate glycerol 3-phosphate acyltransferase [Candidatus Lambdaproteobacteria bacterium RIFOXYD12_FULL_49_8]|uniref:Glycerol-3-phosphate acyltransferase n=1 Tax=Candidatus Lambdaproteobacteria bacterium RIFOXYD2_FULL_50_16 TaxID=1817772 RepID=A0A1F6G5D6_9PROT|nr:MAG: acyl-phosphate glycerol 3-phosphate acyltransferase [Candidatus Lambdaproteobacteria bacterium RIFOXYD2_FULL_50_16]OGG97568.1 MAG: acyl-phosphate glycerol 3-phosphate acyltransferase [Candidatus Lambdaproteobacteria bacterium RIFOXYD12_FULL_49_8]